MPMARKSNGFNLTAAIRDYRKNHRGISAKNALEGIKKAHPGEKINDGTFKSTFYKLAGSKKKKSVMRRRPGRSVKASDGHAEWFLKAGLTFIGWAGGAENAPKRRAGMEGLMEAGTP